MQRLHHAGDGEFQSRSGRHELLSGIRPSELASVGGSGWDADLVLWRKQDGHLLEFDLGASEFWAIFFVRSSFSKLKLKL